MDRTLDFIIIIFYLISIASIGIFTGGKQKTVHDYFLGARSVPWWAVCFSIVAAETSTLTFISIPGLAYLTNMNFLQLAVGYLLGRIFIAYFLLPSYFKGEMDTAYAYLGKRFGLKTRRFGSIVFLITRIASDGVRLFATAIPLKFLLGISYPAAILIITIVTLIYTLIGGVRGIIWVDMVQMIFYIGGALIACAYLLSDLPNGIETVISIGNSGHKFDFIHWGFEGGIKGFFSQPYTFIASLLGGAFLSMASHGTDQLIIQRLLVTRNLTKSRKAIIGSGVVIIFQFSLFLFVGVALYAFYGKLGLKSDEIFPKFIIENLPVGISGLIIAGLLAAAMSTLAGSISSLSSSTMLDLLNNKYKSDSGKGLLVSRLFSVMWAVLLMASAFMFIYSSHAVVELALSIASFTFGGLLGTFLLGHLVKKAKQEDALAGFVAGIFIMITVISLNIVAWTWYILIGVITTVLIGWFLSRLTDSSL